MNRKKIEPLNMILFSDVAYLVPPLVPLWLRIGRLPQLEAFRDLLDNAFVSSAAEALLLKEQDFADLVRTCFMDEALRLKLIDEASELIDQLSPPWAEDETWLEARDCSGLTSAR
jgi:hypothetical protein